MVLTSLINLEACKQYLYITACMRNVFWMFLLSCHDTRFHADDLKIILLFLFCIFVSTIHNTLYIYSLLSNSSINTSWNDEHLIYWLVSWSFDEVGVQSTTRNSTSFFSKDREFLQEFQMDENIQMSRQGTVKLHIHDFTRPSASLYGTESGYDLWIHY